MKTTIRKHSTNENVSVKVETDNKNWHYLRLTTNGYQINSLMIDSEIAQMIIEALEEHFKEIENEY